MCVGACVCDPRVMLLTKMSSGLRSRRHGHLKALPRRSSESDLIVFQFGFCRKKNFNLGSTVGFIVVFIVGFYRVFFVTEDCVFVFFYSTFFLLYIFEGC